MYSQQRHSCLPSAAFRLWMIVNKVTSVICSRNLISRPIPAMKSALEGISQAVHVHAHRTREQIHAAGEAIKTKAKRDSSEEDLTQVPAYTVDLTFRFIGASGLPPMDVGGSSDPYFVASLDDTISFTSSVKPRTLTPVWNAEWFVKNVPVTAQLEVKLYDKDNGAVRDDFIGKFKLGLQEGAREVRIESSAGAQMGTMWLEVRIINNKLPVAPCSFTKRSDAPQRDPRARRHASVHVRRTGQLLAILQPNRRTLRWFEGRASRPRCRHGSLEGDKGYDFQGHGQQARSARTARE